MMKRLLFFMTCLTFVVSLYSQQKEFKKEWNIGVGFGSVFSSMSFVPTKLSQRFDSKSLSQIQFGVSARYMVEPHLGIIGELNYTQAGWEEKFKSELGFQYRQKLNYIDLPLMTHIYFGSKKTRFYLNIGPKIGYLIGEKEEANQALLDWLNSGSIDPDKDVVGQYNKPVDRKFDYGLIGGMGAELRTGLGNFLLEGRYYMGFSDIFSNSKSDLYLRSANRMISVHATYFIKAF